MSEFNKLNIFDDLVNITDYTDIETLFTKTDTINYNPVEFNVLTSKFEKNNDIEIDILLFQNIQIEYVKTYASDFIDFFTLIFNRNENETYSLTDDINQQILKDNLYTTRQNDIIEFKVIFFKMINFAKRFKGSLKYIEYIVDFFVRMKYGQQLYTNNDENNDILTSGLLNIGSRYKLISGAYSNYVPGNIFTVTASETISGFTVIPQFILEINKIDNTVYELLSVVTYEEWETILKPIVHPLGWNAVYTNFSIVDNFDTLVQHKNIILDCEKNKYINLSYNFEDTQINYNEIGNISFQDFLKTNNSGIRFAVYSVQVGN